MTGWYYFKTADTEHCGRAVRLAAKRQARGENKKLALINAAQRKAERTEAMIRDLQKAVQLLDHSIEAELDSSWIGDTSHFAFPMSARALITRRDNLKATIAALSDQRAGSDVRRASIATNSANMRPSKKIPLQMP